MRSKSSSRFLYYWRSFWSNGCITSSAMSSSSSSTSWSPIHLPFLNMYAKGQVMYTNIMQYTGWPVFDLTVWNVKYLKNLWRNIGFLLHKSLHIQKGLENQGSFTSLLTNWLVATIFVCQKCTWIYGCFYLFKCSWHPNP